MAPKVPSDKVLEKALEDAVFSIFNGDERAQLTVNYARQVAEEKLGLEDGFFKSDDWLTRSKLVARQAVAKAEAAALSSQQPDSPGSPVDSESEPTPQPKPKAKPKARPRAKAVQKPKTKNNAKPRKRKAASEDDESEPLSSAVTDISDSSDSDSGDSDDGDASVSSSDSAPKRKGRQTKGAAKGKKRKTVSDDEDNDDDENTVSDSEPKPPRKKAKSNDKPKSAPKVEAKPTKQVPKPDPAPESDSSLSDAPTGESNQAEVAVVTKVGTPIVEDESEMSEVFDEPPKRKGKSAGKASKGERKPKAAPKSASVDQSPDDALIKQLQSQLGKCGVRKIWGFELKKFGDDKKAKIRHLKGLLTDIGMVGRFSESRAREIKEHRELMADLDAVKEGEKSWGLGSSRPKRRAAAATKSLKLPSDSDDEGDNSGDAKENDRPNKDDSDEGSEDSGMKAKPRARGAAHRAALAFLGDDSDESE